jgi:hypothetical protein
VYRIVVPGRHAAAIDIRTLYGDADLELYSAWARTVLKPPGLLIGSYRPRRARDGVLLSNPYWSRRAAWVVVFPADKNVLDAGYRLQVRRARFRR